ncbi:MAG TPA: hypothetical protein VKM54_08195 [Myxococcota bacterium]|nr:hypothetical protein [Myxococcota bacterium]
MTARSSILGFASALALALLVAAPGHAMDETTAHGLPPEARVLASGATSRAALPIVCAPRRGSPVGAAAGFGLAIAGAAALSRRRTDRPR